jgi:hypothetical protein
MDFGFQIGKFLIKIERRALHFYLGLKNQPWFCPADSENACVFRMRKRHVTTQL